MTMICLALLGATTVWIIAEQFAWAVTKRRRRRKISQLLRSRIEIASKISEYERQKDRFLEAGPPSGSASSMERSFDGERWKR